MVITGFFKRGGKTMPISAPIRPEGGAVRVALPKQGISSAGLKKIAQSSAQGASFTARKFQEFNEQQAEKKLLKEQEERDDQEVKDALKNLNTLEEVTEEIAEDEAEQIAKDNEIEDPEERDEAKRKTSEEADKKRKKQKEKEDKAKKEADKDLKDSNKTRGKSRANDDRIRQSLIILKPSRFA